MRGKRLYVLLALALLVFVLSWALSKTPGGGTVREETMEAPPGYWIIDRRSRSSSDEMARLLSLPYSASGEKASGESGVLYYDPAKSWGAYNLYCSGHGPEALLMDMGGRVLHRWRFPYERAFPGRPLKDGTSYWRRVRLGAGGSLVALYQGGGLVKVDRDSHLLWRLDRGTYNDIRIASDGTVCTVTKDARIVPRIDPLEPVLEDKVLFLSADGRPEREVSVLAAFLRSEYAAFVRFTGERDLLHLNTVELLEAPAAGHVLFSARNVDTIGVLDPDLGRIVWARRGSWSRQHDPRLLSDGHILLFDNQGGEGGRSRVLEIDPASGDVVWSFEHESFSSFEGGACSRLPNGNTLVTSTVQGRAFEVTRDGEVVWEFVNPHRGGERDEFLASLWEVERLGEDFDPAVLGR